MMDCLQTTGPHDEMQTFETTFPWNPPKDRLSIEKDQCDGSTAQIDPSLLSKVLNDFKTRSLELQSVINTDDPDTKRKAKFELSKWRAKVKSSLITYCMKHMNDIERKKSITTRLCGDTTYHVFLESVASSVDEEDVAGSVITVPIF